MKNKHSNNKAFTGFTLAELLIALAILGVIVTFTIPRLLVNVTNSQNTAIAKDAAAMVAGSFSSYQLNNNIVSGTTAADLTQFMNYVNLDTSTTYTGSAGTPLQACSTTLPCIVLHNGGVMQYDTAMTMGGTGLNNGVYVNFDPDGDGTAGRISFVQYANGRITSGQHGGSVTPTGGTLTREATDPDYLESWN